MTRTQYFFSFVLATISFIAARSIQREGIENYYDQITNTSSKDLGFIDFEHPLTPAYLPMGLQPFTALTSLDSTQSFVIAQDSLHILRYDLQHDYFLPFSSETAKMTQITGFDSTLVFLDTEQNLHFINTPDGLEDKQTYSLNNEENTKHLMVYHPTLKRILLLNSQLLENGDRQFVCQTFHTGKRQLSAVPLFAFESKEILFEPISMAIHPQTNEFYLLSSAGEVVVINQNGEIRSRQQLPKTISQPKVISFDANGDLLATDANVLHPILMRLPWKKTISNQGALVH
jgi:hypothetical protein